MSNANTMPGTNFNHSGTVGNASNSFTPLGENPTGSLPELTYSLAKPLHPTLSATLAFSIRSNAEGAQNKAIEPASHVNADVSVNELKGKPDLNSSGVAQPSHACESHPRNSDNTTPPNCNNKERNSHPSDADKQSFYPPPRVASEDKHGDKPASQQHSAPIQGNDDQDVHDQVQDAEVGQKVPNEEDAVASSDAIESIIPDKRSRLSGPMAFSPHWRFARTYSRAQQAAKVNETCQELQSFVQEDPLFLQHWNVDEYSFEKTAHILLI